MDAMACAKQLAAGVAVGWLGWTLAFMCSAEPTPEKRYEIQSVPGCGSGIDGPYRVIEVEP